MEIFTFSKRAARCCALFALALLTGCFNNDPEQSFSTSVQGVYSADFSADGEHAAVGSIQHGGSLWRTEDAERLYNWNHQSDQLSAITALAFSPDGQYVVTADNNTLVLWEVDSGEALRFFESPGEIRFIDLTPSAERALLGMADNRSILFDIQQGGIKQQVQHAADLIEQTISADGTRALASLDNRTLSFWDLRDKETLEVIEVDGRVNTIALSHDGRFAFSPIQHRSANIWDLDSKQIHSELRYNNKFFPSFSSFLTARFYDDQDQLMTGNTTGAAELWDINTGRRLGRWVTPKSASFGPTNFSVVAVAKQDQSGRVIAMTSDCEAHLYSVASN